MISTLCGFTGILMNVVFILLALVILMVMITIHELGHYTAGKLLKFKINEFSIGFGKSLYSKTKKNGEKFSIRLIPIGGYCAFEGEDKSETEKDSFNAQAPWKRLIVLFCGAFFNFISAILFSIILIAVIGDGTQRITKVENLTYVNQQHIEVTHGNVGIIQEGDIILKVNGKKVSFLNGGIRGRLISDIKDNKDIVLLVDRDGVKQEIIVQKYATQDATGQTIYKLGVNIELNKVGFAEALVKCVPFSFEVAWECLVLFGQLITGQISLKDLGGPVTTVSTIATASSQSLMNLLLLIPLISINLAVFNLLPIPALDGARMVFVVIEWIRKKPINRDLEAKIHTVGIIVLFSFVIIIDFLQLFIFR